MKSARLINIVVALAVSLIVNFSYVLLLLVDRQEETPASQNERVVARAEEGTLHLDPDGHGYLVYAEGDSVYVPQQRIRRLGLAEGDRLVVDVLPHRHAHRAHATMMRVHERNGAEFDYGAIFNRPSQTTELALQLIYYFVVSWVLLTILTAAQRNYSKRRFAWRCLWCVAAAVALYLLAPVEVRRSQRLTLNILSGSILDNMLLLKCTFAVAVSMLYAWVYVLNARRQAVVVENQRLQNENLTTRYNMLVGQINPHFFFNSLNSLSLLVREKEDKKALEYIDRLSYTFRYILQNGQAGLITLDEELRFVEAYCYLFKIRYADKLFFDIAIEEQYLHWLLPAFSLQPLLDNAVKHNTITANRPLHVSIRTEEGWLIVSNPKIPKFDAEPSTGIGLENLRNRWLLLTGREIEVLDDGKSFTVRLPLQREE